MNNKKPGWFSRLITILLFNLGVSACIVLSVMGLMEFTAIMALAGCVTALAMGVASFFYVNNRLLLKDIRQNQPRIEQKQYNIEQITKLEECDDALEKVSSIRTFTQQINNFKTQIRRFQKKQASIRTILLQRFSETEMSFQRFDSVVRSIEGVIFTNIKDVIHRLSAFDEEDYLNAKREKLSGQANRNTFTRLSIYDEYIAYAEKEVAENEEFLLKLDMLIAELSKLNTGPDQQKREENVLEEITALIDDTQLYNS